jgi:hypothetical protein
LFPRHPYGREGVLAEEEEEEEEEEEVPDVLAALA